MIHGHADHVGVLAKRRLEAGSGQVAHAFHSSLYLRTGHLHTADQLFCLLVKQLPRGPLNLNTSIDSFTDIAVDTLWHYDNECLIIDNHLTISLNHITSWSPVIPAVATHSFEKKLDTVKAFAQTLSPHHASAISKAISNRQSLGERALNQWLRTTAQPVPDELKYIVGCGEGLTPAGDDFLSGAIVTLNYLQLDPAKSVLQEWITLNAPGNTSEISLAHLLAACEGHASEPVHRFFCAFFSIDTNARSLTERCRDVIAIGHNSGWYLLQGILSVLQSEITDRSQ